MLKTANHVVHLSMLSMVWVFGGYDLVDTLLVTTCMATSWVTCHIALTVAVRHRSTDVGVLSIGIVVLYWVAYVTKFGLGTLFSDQYWVVPLVVSHQLLVSEMPHALFIATIGFVALMTAVLTFPLRSTLKWEIPEFRARTRALSIVVPLALVFKYLLKQEFNLGVPGLDPVYLGIPYLAGVLTFVIDTSFIFVSNILLFAAVTSGRPKLMLYGFVLGFANAAIDLRFGSKDTVVYQLAISAVYLAMSRYSVRLTTSQSRRTFFIGVGVLAATAVSVVAAYKFFNFFRFALLAGGDIDLMAAINSAVSSDIAGSRSSIMEIYNRITGLETLAALLHIADAIRGEPGLAALIGGTLVRNFTSYIMGTDDVMTRFSVTQFGYYYLSGGMTWLVVGTVGLAYAFCFIQRQVLRMRVHHAMKIAFLPTLWILFIKSLLGGGDMILWLKEVLVLVGMFYVTARLACPRRVQHAPARWGGGAGPSVTKP